MVYGLDGHGLPPIEMARRALRRYREPADSDEEEEDQRGKSCEKLVQLMNFDKRVKNDIPIIKRRISIEEKKKEKEREEQQQRQQLFDVMENDIADVDKQYQGQQDEDDRLPIHNEGGNKNKYK